MKMKIYKVTKDGADRLIRAKTASGARKHVLGTIDITVVRPTEDELVDLLQQEIEIEEVEN